MAAAQSLSRTRGRLHPPRRVRGRDDRWGTRAGSWSRLILESKEAERAAGAKEAEARLRAEFEAEKRKLEADFASERNAADRTFAEEKMEMMARLQVRPSPGHPRTPSHPRAVAGGL